MSISDNADFMHVSGARRANTNIEKSTIYVALANHKTPIDVDVKVGLSKLDLHKVPSLNNGQVNKSLAMREVKE